MSTQVFKDGAAATKHREGVGTGADSSNGFSGAVVPLGWTSAAPGALADATANPPTILMGDFMMVWNGTTWDRLKGDTTSGAWVNVKASALPSGAATLAEQQAQTTLLGLIEGNTDGTEIALGDVRTYLGATNESAAGSDTATSGLNGLFKRLLQRLTALLPAALGAGGGLKVDGSGTALPVSLASLPALVAGSNAIGSVTITEPATGEYTPDCHISTADVNANVLKASPGKLGLLYAGNNGAAGRYLKLYDKATTPAVGTDTPKQVYFLPAGGGGSIPLGKGLNFAAGIAFGITVGIADSDTAAINAQEVAISFGYK